MRFDAVIIGGSFAGLSAAWQLARAERQVCLIDSGRPRNRFADYADGRFGGQADAAPGELLARARAKVAASPDVRYLAAEAIAAEGAADAFGVTLAGGHRLRARRLVLAFGLADDLPPLPGLAERWGRTVLHCPFSHGPALPGRPLGVLGAGLCSARHAALVADWGPTVYFLNGGPPLRPADVARLTARGVRVEPAPIAALLGNAPDLAAVLLADGRRIPVAALYAAPRTSLRSPLARQLGCAVEPGLTGPYLTTDPRRRTTVARPLHHATLASADGVLAGAAVHQSLFARA